MCGRADVCTGSGSMRTVHGAVEILKNWKLAQYFLLYNCTSLLQLYFLQVPPRSGEEKSVERDRRGLEVGGRSASARSGKSGKSAKSGTRRTEDSDANIVHISSERSSKMKTAGVDILQRSALNKVRRRGAMVPEKKE